MNYSAVQKQKAVTAELMKIGLLHHWLVVYDVLFFIRVWWFLCINLCHICSILCQSLVVIVHQLVPYLFYSLSEFGGYSASTCAVSVPFFIRVWWL